MLSIAFHEPNDSGFVGSNKDSSPSWVIRDKKRSCLIVLEPKET